MNLDELTDADLLPAREVREVPAEVVGNVAEGDYEMEPFYADIENLFEDLKRSVDLIKRTNVFLRFLSDPDLVKTITKRERIAMEVMIKKGKDLLIDIEPAILEVAS